MVKRILLSFLIIFFLFSCSDSDNIFCKNITSEQGRIRISVAEASRTIFPQRYDFFGDKSLSFELYVKNDMDSVIFEKSWESENDILAIELMQDDNSIILNQGFYTFVLHVTKNQNLILKKTIENKEILNGENIIDFDIMETNNNGFGKLFVSLQFPKSEFITKVECGLYTLDGKEVIDFGKETLPINKNDFYIDVNYSKVEVPVGIYRVKFDIFGNNMLLNTYREIIHIAPETKSEAYRTLDNINEYYTIKYENLGKYNGADDLIIQDTYFLDEVYDIKRDVVLPTAENLQRNYYLFAGWYTSPDFSGDKVEGWKSGEKRENVVLYAKWVTNSQMVISAINQLSGDDCKIIFLSDYSTKATGSPETNTPFIIDLTELQHDYLPESAFSNWRTLKGIVWNDQITEIPGFCFENCDGLREFYVSDSVTEIGGNAFKGCSSLSYFNTNKNVLKIGSKIFADCPKMTVVIGSLAFMTSGFSSPFSYGTEFLIAIEENISEIPDFAFAGCSLIKSIVIPARLQLIGDYAFKDCVSIKELELHNEVTEIGSEAFSGCEQLESINMPDSITNIGSRAFEKCTALESINYPAGTLKIERAVFENCTSLKEIQLPNSLTEIKEKAFLGCSALESINIPNTVVNIGSSAFEGCSNLKNVTLPSALKSISSNAFYNCSHAFQIVDLTNTEITDIGSNAFSACSSLKEIHLPNTCKLNKACFSGCSSLESTNIPSCMTELPAEIFMDCSSLKNIVIPEKITIIRNSAFRKCTSLEELELPDSVVKLCPFFIQHCTSLKRFNYSGNQADWKSRGVDDDRDYLTPTSGHFTLDELVNSVSIAENYWARY